MVFIKKRVIISFFISGILPLLICSLFFQSYEAFNNYFKSPTTASRWVQKSVNEFQYADHIHSLFSTASDSVGQSAGFTEKNSGKLPLPFMNVESIGLSGRWIQQGGNFILKPQFNESVSSSTSSGGNM